MKMVVVHLCPILGSVPSGKLELFKWTTVLHHIAYKEFIIYFLEKTWGVYLKYSWPLDDRGLNYADPIINRSFSMVVY